jgi:hypothetical protein
LRRFLRSTITNSATRPNSTPGTHTGTSTNALGNFSGATLALDQLIPIDLALSAAHLEMKIVLTSPLSAAMGVLAYSSRSWTVNVTPMLIRIIPAKE